MKSLSWVPNALTLGNLLGGAVVCWAAASGEFLGQALLWDSAGADMALATQMVAAVWMFACLRRLRRLGGPEVGGRRPAGRATGQPGRRGHRRVGPGHGGHALVPRRRWAGFDLGDVRQLGGGRRGRVPLARFNVTADSGDGGNWFEGCLRRRLGFFGWA